MIRDFFDRRPRHVCHYCRKLDHLHPVPGSFWMEYTCKKCGGEVDAMRVLPGADIVYVNGHAVVTSATSPTVTMDFRAS